MTSWRRRTLTVDKTDNSQGITIDHPKLVNKVTEGVGGEIIIKINRGRILLLPCYFFYLKEKSAWT